MEGVGSRLGRVSSRYGAAPVFSGPVRRWKKQWVQVSSSSSSLSYGSGSFHSNIGHGNNNNNSSSVRLPRWTPLSGDNVKTELPPKKKLRYTPIVVLEEKKTEGAKKADYESMASKTNQSIASETSESVDIENPGFDNGFMEETQASDKSEAAPEHLNNSRMDLDLALKGPDDSHDSDGENGRGQLGKGGRDQSWALK